VQHASFAGVKIFTTAGRLSSGKTMLRRRTVESVADHLEKLIHALSERVPYADDRAMPIQSTSSADVNRLFELVAQVPTLLRDCDAVASNSNGMFIDRLRSLDQALTSWVDAACMTVRREGHELRGNETIDAKDDTMPLRYRNSLCSLTCESLCRISLLLISECIDTLQNRKSSSFRQHRSPDPVLCN
jgi:hypothetical protein